MTSIISFILTALACFVTPTKAGEGSPAASQQADAQTESRRDLQQFIDGKGPSSRPSASDHLTAMLDEQDRNEDLIVRIDRYLEKHPADPARETFLLAKLEAIYVAGTLGGRNLERLEREVKSVLAHESAPRLREAAEYWQLRLDLHHSAQKDLGGESSILGSQERIKAYLNRHPKSPESAGLLDELFEKAVRVRDVESADRWLTLLRENHPSHVTALAAAGEMNLLRQIGQVWNPNWKTVEGKPLAWIDRHGRVEMVIFFSARHVPSAELLEHIAASRERQSDPPGVVSVSLDIACDQAAAVLKRLQVSWPLVCDGLGWKSEMCSQWGIRDLPTVLVLDESGVLRNVITPRWGEIWPAVEQSVQEMRRPNVTATSRSSDAENHSK